MPCVASKSGADTYLPANLIDQPLKLGPSQTLYKHNPATKEMTMKAMNEVMGLVRDGEIVVAQALVLATEAEGSTLPSSVFEVVLKAAVKADQLLPDYAQFCQRAYGKAVYAKLVG